MKALILVLLGAILIMGCVGQPSEEKEDKNNTYTGVITPPQNGNGNNGVNEDSNSNGNGNGNQNNNLNEGNQNTQQSSKEITYCKWDMGEAVQEFFFSANEIKFRTTSGVAWNEIIFTPGQICVTASDVPGTHCEPSDEDLESLKSQYIEGLSYAGYCN